MIIESTRQIELLVIALENLERSIHNELQIMKTDSDAKEVIEEIKECSFVKNRLSDDSLLLEFKEKQLQETKELRKDLSVQLIRKQTERLSKSA